MRAFMSGPNEFGTANDYCRHCAAENEFPGLRQNASATEAWIASKARLAEREARAILANVKPSEGWPVSTSEWDSEQPVWNLAPWQLRGACYRDAAEALAAFVGDAQ